MVEFFTKEENQNLNTFQTIAITRANPLGNGQPYDVAESKVMVGGKSALLVNIDVDGKKDPSHQASHEMLSKIEKRTESLLTLPGLNEGIGSISGFDQLMTRNSDFTITMRQGICGCGNIPDSCSKKSRHVQLFLHARIISLAPGDFGTEDHPKKHSKYIVFINCH